MTLDPVALEVARAAAVADAGTAEVVGEFRSAFAEDDIAVTAGFSAALPGYLGWQWSVTLALLSPEHPTVSEVVLLPGPGALLAPAWIPWDERIRPGDVGVGDLLPPAVDDPRLVPAYLQSDDPAVEAVAGELGVGRVRVLSREGRIEFAERLHEGSFGPSDEMAIAAPGRCFSCAFYLPLAGSLGQLTGACGNEFAPADGRVVDAEYGCGAHSETVIEMPARSATTDTVIDELSLEVHRRAVRVPSQDWNEMPANDVAESMPEGEEALLDGDEAVLDDALDAEPVDPDLIGAELNEEDLAAALLLDAPVPGSGPPVDPQD